MKITLTDEEAQLVLRLLDKRLVDLKKLREELPATDLSREMGPVYSLQGKIMSEAGE